METGCGESLEYGLKIAELHKTIAERDKFISRLSEQAKAQIQEYKEVAKALFGFSLSKYKTPDSKTVAGQYQVSGVATLMSLTVLGHPCPCTSSLTRVCSSSCRPMIVVYLG